MARQRGKRIVDETLLKALACGCTVETAAQAARVSPATVYRRLKEDEFCRRLKKVRADMMDRTSGMLTAAGGEFVKTLLALVKETAPPAVRLGAARAGLEIGMRIREVTELEERIAALEEQLLASGKGP